MNFFGKNNHASAGFTLVELLVVVTLSTMLLLGASAIFMIFLLGSTKTQATQTVKTEGQQALQQIEFLLRNAVELETNQLGVSCEALMSEIQFKSIDGGVTRLFAEEDSSDGATKIASNSGVYLTSNEVEITDGPTFTCVDDTDRAVQHITVTFTLRKGAPGVQTPIEIVEETFTTGVNIRSY